MVVMVVILKSIILVAINDTYVIHDSHIICILGQPILSALGRHEDAAVCVTQRREEAEQAVGWLEEVELKQGEECRTMWS